MILPEDRNLLETKRGMDRAGVSYYGSDNSGLAIAEELQPEHPRHLVSEVINCGERWPGEHRRCRAPIRARLPVTIYYILGTHGL